MPPLPPRMPTPLPRATPTAPGRAQQFSASQVSRHKRTDTASSSIGRAIQERNARKQQGVRTSAAGGSRPAKTSIYHNNPATRSLNDSDHMYVEAQDAARDRLRYQHIRKLMKEKKAADDAAKKGKA